MLTGVVLGISVEEEVASLEKKLEETKRQIFLNLSAWDRVKIARHPKRDVENGAAFGAVDLRRHTRNPAGGGLDHDLHGHSDRWRDRLREQREWYGNG